MSDKEIQEVRFHYLKSPAFCTVHADGVIGGLTPRADVHMAFYAERMAIPTETVHTLNADGSLGPELRDRRVSRDGVVRELVVDVVMDLDTAVRIHAWLGRHLEMGKKRFEEAQAKAATRTNGGGEKQ